MSAVALYQPHGARVLNRAGSPSWMTLDEAERECFRLTAELVRSEDPGLIIPRINELAWAIRDARVMAGETRPTMEIAA